MAVATSPRAGPHEHLPHGSPRHSLSLTPSYQAPNVREEQPRTGQVPDIKQEGVKRTQPASSRKVWGGGEKSRAQGHLQNVASI